MIHEAARQGFQAGAAEYERGRPSFPREAVELLERVLELGPRSRVVDVGAGTGKFTRLLAGRAGHLIAVEPVAAMREKCAANVPQALVLEGTAEKLPLADGSVDAIVCAQAFHWFSSAATLAEFHRVIRPRGRLALIWNVRDETHDWVRELTAIVDRHEGGAPRHRTGLWRRPFEETRLFSPLESKQFAHAHSGDLEAVVDRVASISFIAALPAEARAKVLEEVRSLVLTHPQTRDLKTIDFPYRTDVYWCERS